MIGWERHAAALADELVARGKLRSPEWIRAVRETPRHVFVPEHLVLDPSTHDWARHRTTPEQVYSNIALFVLAGGLSSSSMPGLMTRMLESLDVADGHRVLEIGTGTGYNAALLCHRLGSAGVVSVDVEPSLVALARDRLATLGYQPTLVAGDGRLGVSSGAPYDRVIATCSVPAVPWPWVQQTRDGGLILVDVKIGHLAGNLVLLRRDGDRAVGRFDPVYASFMPMRSVSVARGYSTSQHSQAAQPPRRRPTALDVRRPWEHGVTWFLLHQTTPGVMFGLRDGDPALWADDGSYCEVGTDGVVRWSGPRDLWALVEAAWERWHALGDPGWDCFGLTVTRAGQSVWFGAPRS